MQNTQENINQYRRKEDVCFFTHLRKSTSNTPWGPPIFLPGSDVPQGSTLSPSLGGKRWARRLTSHLLL